MHRRELRLSSREIARPDCGASAGAGAQRHATAAAANQPTRMRRAIGAARNWASNESVSIAAPAATATILHTPRRLAACRQLVCKLMRSNRRRRKRRRRRLGYLAGRGKWCCAINKSARGAAASKSAQVSSPSAQPQPPPQQSQNRSNDRLAAYLLNWPATFDWLCARFSWPAPTTQVACARFSDAAAAAGN